MFLTGIVPYLFAGGQHWAAKSTGNGNERVVDVKADLADGLVSIGEFGPGASVLGQPLTCQGLSDVFVVKQSASGALQWVQQAGGAGLDFAGKVCAAPDGSVVVCGQFTGTADLFGTSVSAQGGSTDFFVAKLSGTNGSLTWVRTGGSAAYTDRAANVAVGTDGRVLVTGEFRGGGIFDAGTFNSTIDPGTSLPGSDVFIASYSADGTAEWFKQGIAEQDDQAADVAIDGSGAAYAFGLYSGTMSFGTPHPNTALNQMYLVKFDAAGDEQWFRRIGGAALQQPVDMQLGADGVFLCGELQGGLTFFDTAPNTVPSAQPNAYFLLRAGADGEFVSGTATGSVNTVRIAGLDQRGNTVAAYGEFECGFTDLQDHYDATGIFIATGEEDLFIAKHDAQTLALDEAQQFGGHEGKTAGGITSLSNGELVFCGGFSELLIFPSEGDAWGDLIGPCPLTGFGAALYCGDAHYTSYAGVQSTGALDGFIARGYVDSRQPYDPYMRSGLVCDRSATDIIVLGNGDSTDYVLACGTADLEWPRNIHYYPEPSICDETPSVSWDVDILWSTGQTYGDGIGAAQSGWYWRTQTSSNGCYTETDSIQVEILPAPQAWISINNGFPMAGPGPTPYTACQPVEMLATDLLPGETFQWYIDGEPVPGNPILADAPGSYSLTVTSPNGCVGTNLIAFDLLEAVNIPNITSADFDFYFNGVALDQQDSVQICDGVFQQGYIHATWYVDGVPTELGPPFIVFATTESGGGLVSYANQAISWFVEPEPNGWYDLQIHLVMNVEGCLDDSMAFDASDSVYFAAGNSPQIAPLEDITLCLGDTAMVVLDCTGCSQIQWSGPGPVVTSPGQDTAWVTEFGNYSVIAMNNDGVLCGATEYFMVSQALPPALVVSPLAVCSGDTAVLSTSFQGTTYEWSGPSGPLVGDDDSLLIWEIGSYYLTVYTDQGCPLFGGPAFLQEFATPSLAATPNTVLCPGQATALVISGGGLEQIIWDPPFSGGSLTQSVSEGGTYTCTVIACEDTFDLSVDIFSSTIMAEIPPGPYSICGGGSALLDGPAGDYTYLWTPGNAATEDLLATDTGSYQLQITDTLGCMALSNVVEVSAQSFTEALVTSGDTVCAGEDAQLSATGSGTLVWYTQADLQDTLIVGGVLTIQGAAQSDTVYVTQTESGCTGPVTPVVILVGLVPSPPVITGDTSLCIGDALSLSVTPQPGVTYTWTTPQGAVTGPTVSIGSVSASDIGTYVCTTSVQGCPGSSTSVSLVLEAGPEAPEISGETELCAGDDLSLEVASVPGISYSWTTPSGGVSGPTVEVANVNPTDEGVYVCFASAGDCGGEGAEVTVNIQLPPPIPVVSGPDTLCDGESGSVTVVGVTASFSWVTPQGTTVGGAMGYPIWAATPEDNGEYGVLVDGGACPDVSAFTSITVVTCDGVVPNVFTPNADGVNDYFLIEGSPGVTYYFKVYNRWGQLVFSTPRVEAIRWDGRDDGNDMLPDGVYYYELIRITFGRSRTSTGYIQLSRGR